MTQAITPSTDIGRLAQQLHRQTSPAQLRRSEQRRQDLEQYAVTMADGQELRLQLDTDKQNSARVTLRGEHPVIWIPARKFPQPVTDFDRKPYDYLLQKTLTIHEIGHVLYTDQEAVDNAMSAVAPQHHEFFHRIWNALEDGAIEEELRREFNVAGDLAVTNANFGAAGAKGVNEYGMADAILTACLDLAVHDSGRLDALIDPDDSSTRFKDSQHRQPFISAVLPELQDAAADVVGESDPEARAERILELWERLKEILNLDELESPQIDHGGKGNHADQDSGTGDTADNLDDIDEDSLRELVNRIANRDDSDSSETQTGDGSAGQDSDRTQDDITEGDGSTDNGGATDAASGGKADGSGTVGSEAADDDSQDDTAMAESEAGQADVDTETNEREDGTGDTSSGDAGQQSEDDGSQTTPNPSEDSVETPSRQPDRERQLAQEEDDTLSEGVIDGYERRVQEQESEAEATTEDVQEEFEALRRALERIDEADEQPTELEVTNPSPPRTDAWMDAKRTGNRLKRILNQRLQEEERGRMRRGLRRGTIDSRALVRIKTRDYRLFRKREKPETKDYAAVLILDRSGSMNRDIEETEEACASMAYALSALNIETCVIDVCGRTPKLAKPFEVDPEDCTETLLTGETSGSTPLTPALRVARERLKERDEFPFVVILTDGRPNKRRKYMDELERCQFPVLGVYVNFGGSSDPASVDQSSEYFDERRIVTSRNQLPDELRKLCQSVMF